MNIDNALCNVQSTNPTQVENMNTNNMRNAYVGNRPTQKHSKATQKHNKPLT
jgi:hypothetical protein